ACYRQIVEGFPASAGAWLQFAHALREHGLQRECIEAYHQTLACDASLASAYAGLASLRVYRFPEAEIEAMEKLLQAPNLPQDSRTHLHHALGKAYNDAKNYGKSFENYARANAVRRVSVRFDPARLTAHRRICEDFFSA